MPRILLVIILVIILRFIKPGEFQDFSHDWFLELPRFVQGLPGFFRQPLLVFVMIKNRTPVLGSPVYKLSPGIRWINMPPEHIEQHFISDSGRVIINLDRFDMPRLPGTYFLVGWVFLAPARISGYHFHHSGLFFKIRLHTPKTAAGKS